MSKRKELWDTDENAEAYAKYAREFSMYTSTSNDLVLLGTLRPDMRILDIASGTGATIEKILEHTPPPVHITAIDQSQKMIEQAKKQYGTDIVDYIVCAAEELDSHVKGLFDIAFCNSALWEISLKKIVESVFNILKPAGQFIFNMPDQYFLHPEFSGNKNPGPQALSRDKLVTTFESAGFILEKEVIKNYTRSVAELISFFNIPVMKSRFKTQEAFETFIAQFTRLPENASMAQQWAYFVFKKK